jgi:hypothetical protein
MEKIVETSKGTFTVRELTIDEGLNMSPEGEPKEKTFEFVVKCIEPKITVEELKKFGFKEGLALINAVNEINGLTDFQKPVVKN